MYKTLLILKYLRKRRIAWVSLIAVMLCTTMVLVVISVMGGWLNMFKSSFHGLSGDLLVRSNGLAGFPYYEEMIQRLQKTEGVEAAVPSIETFGLLAFGNLDTQGVKVMGFPIDQIGKVDRFPQSLHRQYQVIEDELADPKLPPATRQRLERQLKEPPSFDLLNEVTAPLDELPKGLKLMPPDPKGDLPAGRIAMPPGAPEGLKDRLRYDAVRRNLVFQGRMNDEWESALLALSPDPNFHKAIESLHKQSQSADLIQYPPGNYTGMIPGSGVVSIHRNREGQWEGRSPILYQIPCKLTVLGVTNGGSIDVAGNTTSRNYFIVDDSHTQIWQYDNNFVYVPFDRLQRDLSMQAQTAEDADTHQQIQIPARATEIHIKVTGDIDPNNEAALNVVRDRVKKIVDNVLREKTGALAFGDVPRVETWQESQRLWINAIENEKLLTVVLFGIISVVAIFLIFCIFYMIVVEKTRDIGIVKSVGATASGVAGIFLGYGLTIGVIGSLAGWLLSYLIVHNINEMHAWLGRRLGVQIWNPEVYLFDKIPNTMSAHDVAWILPIAVAASVIGALVPAIRAARMNPVEALRWE